MMVCGVRIGTMMGSLWPRNDDHFKNRISKQFICCGGGGEGKFIGWELAEYINEPLMMTAIE